MNKNIVITGAGGVLCSEFARELAQDGGNIIMLDKNPSGIAVLEQELKQAGLSAAAIQADVLDKSSLMRAREIMLNKFGPCDILINGAGGNHPDGTTGGEAFCRSPLLLFPRMAYKQIILLKRTGKQLPFLLTNRPLRPTAAKPCKPHQTEKHFLN